MTLKTAVKSEETTIEKQSTEQCVHHWIIEPPDGPTSKGVCKICGSIKEFENWKTQEPNEQ